MSEKLGGQIDVKQGEIEGLKGPAAAKQEISAYRATYKNAVDAGQREMATAAGKLKSAEAQAYLTKASGEIAGQLGSMADRGREIIKAHEDAKDGKPEKVPSMKELSGDLNKKLGQLKKSVKAFSVLEEINDKDLPGYEKANDKLNSSEGSKDPLDIFSAKEKLLGDLNRLGPKFMSTAGSREYSRKVVKRYQDLMKKVGEEKDELALGPTARHIVAHDFFKAVKTYENLVAEVKSNPSIDTLRAAEAQAEKIDPTTAHSEIFDDMEKGSYAYINNLYKHLETEFGKAKTNFETLQDGFEEAEKTALTAAATKMIADISAAEKDTVGPLWSKYEPLSRRTDLSGKELEDYEKNEKALMSAYLTLKMTVSPFANSETQYKLEGDIYKQVQEKVQEIHDRIRQIEVNRQTRKSMASLGEVGANVFTYVTFLGEEKDGKIYTFNAAYDALSEEKKQEVRMAVESIISRDEKAVKAETQEAMIELSKSTGNFDQISEVLGEKSKKYAEGLQLLAAGKHTEAIAAFEAYVGQTFSAEELELNSAAITDAKEKILLVKYSGEFYEGIKQYGAGDINGAAKNLNAYVKWAEGSGNKELHKEQISQARDVLHLIGLSKVKQLDDLLEDVKYWKKKDLQDQYGSGGEKIDFRITGPEVDIIVNGIRDLKKKVEKGELIDYDSEFATMKAKVHLYLQKNAIDPENNLINKYSELYEGMNSTDPEVRKKTCIKFAQELRDLRGYNKAREYLDKALAAEYRKAAQEVSQEKVMQEMLGNKMIMDNVRKAAKAYLAEFKKDNPGVSEALLQQQAEQAVFNMWLQKRYSRELRHHMTGKGMADSHEALSLYNNWSPYEEDVDTSWYKPWNYSYMNAEEYDQFCDAAKENLALTIATLPIGFGAGAAGAQIGKVAFRALATRLLVRSGAVGAEAAIVAIEQGGVQAIKFGTQAWKALTPQMQRAVILSRVGAGALSVTVEGTLLLGGSTVAEGIITGESTPITTANLAESIFKALAFRGIGMGGNKLFGKAIQAGGKRGMKALVAMEAMSGVAGTGIEAASLYAKGHGEHVDTGFMLRALLENAITSTGMHLGHSKVEGMGGRRNKVEEAYHKLVASEAEVEFGVTFDNPDSIRSARVTPDGHVAINGKVMKDFTPEVLSVLPEKARKKIQKLSQKEGPDVRKAVDDEPTVPAVKPQKPHDETLVSPDAPKPGEKIEVHGNKTPKQRTQSNKEGTVFQGKNPDDAPTNVNQPKQAPDPGATNPNFDKTGVDTPAAKRSQSAPESAVKSADGGESIPAQQAEAMGNLEKANPEVHERVQKILQKPGEKFSYRPEDLKILSSPDAADLPDVVVEKVLKRDFKEIDQGEGKPPARIYENAEAKVGEGGLGGVTLCYVVEGATSGGQPKIVEGAMKKIHSHHDTTDPTIRNSMQREIDTLRDIMRSPDSAGVLKPLYVGVNDMGETVMITQALKPLQGETGTSLNSPPKGFKPRSRKEAIGGYMLHRMPLEQSLGFLADGATGLHNLSKMGRIHADVKPHNIFVGNVDGKPRAVIGDLDCIPFSDVKKLDVELGVGQDKNNNTFGFSKLYNKTDNSVIPMTPSYNRGVDNHVAATLAWATYHPGQKPPPQVAGLISKGQFGVMLGEYIHHVQLNPDQIPMSNGRQIMERLAKLHKDMMDVPDFTKMNKDLDDAQANPQGKDLDALDEKLEVATDGLDKTLSMDDVAKELKAIQDLVTDGFAADSAIPATVPDAAQ